jgi:hypothetical protein
MPDPIPLKITDFFKVHPFDVLDVVILVLLALILFVNIGIIIGKILLYIYFKQHRLCLTIHLSFVYMDNLIKTKIEKE